MIAAYITRSLVANRKSTIPALVVITVSTAVIILLFGLIEGLQKTINESGDPRNALVLRKGWADESDSVLSIPTFENIKVFSGIGSADQKQLISPEVVLPVPFRGVIGDYSEVKVRGVDPVAFSVHDNVQIIEGAMPRPGEPGVIIGVRQHRRLPGFEMGQTVRIGRKRWPVVGIFRAPGSHFESEIWCDRNAFMSELRRAELSLAYVRLSSPDAQPGFAESAAKLNGLNIEAVSERGYGRKVLSQVAAYIDTVLVLILALALGAIFSGTNTMYAAFVARLREFSTLVAMGFTRRRVGVIVVFESLLLALLGGALAMAITLPAHHLTISFPELSLVYSLEISRRVLIASTCMVGAIGIFASLFSLIHVFRLNVLSGLRD